MKEKEILVPISLGELYDKISILVIKMENIIDEEKLKNIKKEHDILLEISYLEDNEIDPDYIMELMKVNRTLWEVEDKIRVKESKKEFDDEFIELARKVYFSNDKRSKIKKIINIRYHSNLVEEKSYEKYD